MICFLFWDFFLTVGIYNCKFPSKTCSCCTTQDLEYYVSIFISFNIFLLQFLFLLWLTDCSGLCHLISTYLWAFQFFFCYWFLVIILSRNISGNISIFLNLLRFFSLIYHMIYPGECSVCTWEQCVFCHCGMKCYEYVCLAHLV